MKKFTLRDAKYRYFLLTGLTILCFGCVFLRLGWLQIVRHEDMLKMTSNQLQGDQMRHNRAAGLWTGTAKSWPSAL